MNRSHVIPGYWLAHGAISTSGAAINWLMNNVFVELDNTESVERKHCVRQLEQMELFFFHIFQVKGVQF